MSQLQMVEPALTLKLFKLLSTHLDKLFPILLKPYQTARLLLWLNILLSTHLEYQLPMSPKLLPTEELPIWVKSPRLPKKEVLSHTFKEPPAMEAQLSIPSCHQLTLLMSHLLQPGAPMDNNTLSLTSQPPTDTRLLLTWAPRTPWAIGSLMSKSQPQVASQTTPSKLKWSPKETDRLQLSLKRPHLTVPLRYSLSNQLSLLSEEPLMLKLLLNQMDKLKPLPNLRPGLQEDQKSPMRPLLSHLAWPIN